MFLVFFISLATCAAMFIYSYIDTHDAEFSFIFSIATAFVTLVFMFVFVNFIGMVLPKQNQMIDNKPIISINMGSEINGDFILGNGTEHNDLKYYFYKDDVYGFNLCKVSSESSHLKYDSEYPYIETYQNVFTNSWFNWFAINPEHNKYVIHLPQKTVMKEIKVN